MTRRTMVLVLALAGCGGGGEALDAGGSTDTSVADAASDTGLGTDAATVDGGAPIDAASVDGGTPGTDAGAIDAGPAPCGTAQPDITGTSGTEGLVIGRDGSIYYSVSGGVARIAPDGSIDESWLRIPGSTTIWGLALDADGTHLFIGDPSAGQLRVATNLSGTPSQTMLARVTAPNGVTVGPDGAVYVSDFAGDSVLRVDASSGASTTVTTAAIAGADGVAFTDDGTLLVTSYSDGTVVALTLDASHRESARATVARNVPSADGVAVDENGVIYVGGGSRVYRIGASGTPDMTLQMGHPGTANLEWGAGPLACHDLYVATGGGLTRLSLDVGQRAVPWH